LATLSKSNITCDGRVKSVRYEFSGNHTNGSRDTHENAHCSRNKVLLITERSQPNLHCSACVERMRCGVSGKSLQWKLRYGRTAIIFAN